MSYRFGVIAAYCSNFRHLALLYIAYVYEQSDDDDDDDDAGVKYSHDDQLTVIH